jgi:hypothetical protein
MIRLEIKNVFNKENEKTYTQGGDKTSTQAALQNKKSLLNLTASSSRADQHRRSLSYETKRNSRHP